VALGLNDSEAGKSITRAIVMDITSLKIITSHAIKTTGTLTAIKCEMGD
jgi:hypothetical protein